MNWAWKSEVGEDQATKVYRQQPTLAHKAWETTRVVAAMGIPLIHHIQELCLAHPSPHPSMLVLILFPWFLLGNTSYRFLKYVKSTLFCGIGTHDNCGIPNQA